MPRRRQLPEPIFQWGSTNGMTPDIYQWRVFHVLTDSHFRTWLAELIQTLVLGRPSRHKFHDFLTPEGFMAPEGWMACRLPEEEHKGAKPDEAEHKATVAQLQNPYRTGKLGLDMRGMLARPDLFPSAARFHSNDRFKQFKWNRIQPSKFHTLFYSVVWLDCVLVFCCTSSQFRDMVAKHQRDELQLSVHVRNDIVGSDSHNMSVGSRRQLQWHLDNTLYRKLSWEDCLHLTYQKPAA